MRRDRSVLVSPCAFASGAYVNTLSDEGAEGVRRAYPADKLARLAAVNHAYDPDNAFHLNQNIPPRRPGHVQVQQTAAADRRPGNAGRKRQTT